MLFRIDGENGGSLNFPAGLGNGVKASKIEDIDIKNIGAVMTRGTKKSVHMKPGIYYIPTISSGTVVVEDKNGNKKYGVPVESQEVPAGFDIDENGELVQKTKVVTLPKVNAKAVNKFINDPILKTLGIELKPEDIVSATGKLSPNFKVDADGNISFVNIKSYLEDSDSYFEMKDGGWAEKAKIHDRNTDTDYDPEFPPSGARVGDPYPTDPLGGVKLPVRYYF